jgi:hypothetical protein
MYLKLPSLLCCYMTKIILLFREVNIVFYFFKTALAPQYWQTFFKPYNKCNEEED